VGDDLEKRYTPFDRILHGLALGHLGLQKIPHRPPPTRGGQPSSSFPDRLKSPTISTRRAAEIGLASSACRNSRQARPSPSPAIRDERPGAHAELVEALWRISTGIEALYQQRERRLKATTAVEAKVEGALKYFIEAWQSVRPRRRAKP
jgi:hypothetical protein